MQIMTPRVVIPTASLSLCSADWMKQVEDTAVAGQDHVIMTHNIIVSGLERKVLVWLPGRTRDHDEGDKPDMIDARDRLYVVSRCTTCLIHVCLPSEGQ